ncbi:two-component system, response regulator YesN [Paenibacillus catalpae]|uniref:Two-component system, response regulator YesN n=1 Tax=Paenibacillus catalpae TaxID=1045775 RepID=A0A1I1U2J5_9BACL|nr:response regulator [Paenibacillus catalpae]SFD65081.1 two-component system, response regulator YesN [Paenibacillus catalpae]
MAQLLIVDDEAHVVDRLALTVDWKSIGIDQVYKAYSGQEAIEQLHQFSIDIVITDIRMPGMSGLQLISEIDRQWPKTKSILLSGYSEFTYAKQAMRFQTEDYLLKPVKTEDLLATVARVLRKLEREWEEVISAQRMTYTLKEHLPLLRANLLHELLQGKYRGGTALHEKMIRLELGGEAWHRFSLMAIRLDEGFEEKSGEDLSWKEYAVANMAEEVFGGRYALWQTKDAHDYLIFLLTQRKDAEGDDPGWLERTASVLQSAVGVYLKGKVSIMISGTGVFPGDVPAAYNRSITAFRNRIGQEPEQFMRLEDEEDVVTAVRSLEYLYEPPALIHLLEAARWEAVEERYKRIFAGVENGEPVSEEQLLEIYFAIASAYTYIAHKNGRLLADTFGTDYGRMISGMPFRTVHQLREWSFRTLQALQEDIAKETKDNRSSLIDRIRSFIDENVTGDLSLQSVADRVKLHPVYVSKVYKLETGENISDYIQRVKMEEAQSLLVNSDEKVYVIAARLGYQRPHSFIGAFKKTFGMTPQEYRDGHMP